MRVVLVGLGRMGQNHRRVLQKMDGIEIVAIVDPAVDASEIEGVPVLSTVKGLRDERFADFDAAFVVTPTASHAEVTHQLIAMGKDVLVEKPIAASSKDAQALIQHAVRNGVRLAVGHVERFNPVVKTMSRFLEEGGIGTPIHISLTRVGGYPGSVLDGNNVILDLAVHDIDICRKILGSMAVTHAFGHAATREGVLDTAEISLRSKTGVTASIHVNWVTPTKIRTVRITGTEGVCFVDYILQTCTVVRGGIAKVSGFEAVRESYEHPSTTVVPVLSGEPLKAELEQFKRLVEDGEWGDLCSGSEALATVELAEQAMAISNMRYL